MLPSSPVPRSGPGRARQPALAVAVVVALGLAGCGGDGAPNPDDAGGATSTREAAPTTPALVDFRSEEGRFRVQLPEQPERSQQAVPVGDVSLTVVFFTVELSDSVAEVVGYVDYPTEITETDPMVVLDGAANGAAQQVSGTVVSRTPTTANGSPALDFVIEAQGAQVQSRGILVGNRLYLLETVTKEPDPDRFGRLTGSFELV